MARLALVMALTFGMSGQRPDTAAAAAALGVTRRSVQRWLRAEPDTRPRISAGHLERIWQLSRPAETSLRQEDLNATFAREAIERLKLPRGRGVKPAWREQRWLEPHLVGVIEYHRVGLRQASLARVDERRMQEMRRRGELIDFTTVPTRFHATIVTHALLREIDPWRIVVPPKLVRRGNTQTWTADAPLTDVDQLKARLEIR